MEHANIPQWLLDKCKEVRKPKREAVTDALPPEEIDADQAIERARDWLKKTEPAIQGQGGDQHTFAVCAKLRDLGVPLDRMMEVLQPFNERCEPPWTPEALYQKCVNAHKYGQNVAAVDSVEALFDDISEAVPESVVRLAARDGEVLPAVSAGGTAPAGETLGAEGQKKTRTTDTGIPVFTPGVQPIEQIKPGPSLWENVIPEGALGVLLGADGTGKSYALTELNYRYATRKPDYIGRRLHNPDGRGAVYLDLERGMITHQRLGLYARKDGIDPGQLPLYHIRDFPLRLDKSKDVDIFIEGLKRTGADIGLIVMDSLTRLLGDADFNQPGAANSAWDSARRIMDAFRCSLIIAAHNPKSNEETILGSRGFNAGPDLILFQDSKADGAYGVVKIIKNNTMMGLKPQDRFLDWTRQYHTITDDEGDVHVLESLSPGAGPVRNPIKLTSSQQEQFFGIVREAIKGTASGARAKDADVIELMLKGGMYATREKAERGFKNLRSKLEKAGGIKCAAGSVELTPAAIDYLEEQAEADMAAAAFESPGAAATSQTGRE